jgi:hypothetical protein
MIKSKNDPKYHQDNDNDFGFYQIQLLYINFYMKDKKTCFLRNVCITNGYYRHYIIIKKKLYKNYSATHYFYFMYYFHLLIFYIWYLT